MSLYHPTEQRPTAANPAAPWEAAERGAWEQSPGFRAEQGAWHPPGWLVVAGKGVLLVVVVVVVVVEVVVVVVFAVVVFAVVVFAVFARCGRSYADKQREELGGTYWGEWRVSMPACTPVRLLLLG